jgi:hypothetical protein
VKNMFRFARNAGAKNKPKGIRNEVFAYKKRARIISIVVTFVIIFCLIAVVSYYLVSYFLGPNSTIYETGGYLSDDAPRAALIDALYSNHPNDEFTRSVNKTLREAGVKVDVYQGQKVTVEFLSKLKGGYKLVILRMHSALSTTTNALYLFTAEPFFEGKYVQKLISKQVVQAYATNRSSSVFAVNWDFIKMFMTGKFDGALVVMMGCDGACDPWLTEEIINQGAIGYVAWNGKALLSHSDRAILYLIQALYMENLPLEEAVEKTNSQIGKDPKWGSVLDCYVP